MKQKILLIPYVKNGEEIVYFVGKRKLSFEKDASKEIWQLPTGKVGDNVDGEKVIEAALREFEEELGVKKYKNFINQNYFFNWSKEGEQIREYVFALELENEKVKVCKREFEKYGFFNIDRAKKILSYDNHKNFLVRLDEDIRTSKYPKIFVICGPGGCGKGSLMDLIEDKAKIERARTATTRSRGVSDSDKCRIFVSKGDFGRMKKRGQFIETNFFKGNYYGSLKSEVEGRFLEGKSVMIELDLNGLERIKSIYSNVVSIFIYADLKTLKQRMEKRGRDSAKEIERRLKISQRELENSSLCDYIIKNEDGKLKEAAKELINIINKNTVKKEKNEFAK
ncbi:MAG: Guanylate kinase [candidate division WS2 bacterium ADurb.Bin280]|uniref:Guanylate kinase n=1 Tax=candidate division WS2 bacterium ADurb.Bin280 TaxID=1852829 RepID=A0A1V5SGU6_9BACT|nr:MAG: Guanylate kinase [candidate division WS2 bacterium ADurb.Bin280]